MRSQSDNRGGEHVLTIDVGTSNCRAVIFSRDGSVVGSGKTAHREHYPQPRWVEQDPNEWWQAIICSVQQALQSCGVKASQIAGIGVTGQMHGLVLLGENGEALTPCLTLRDGRAQAEAEAILDTLGLDEIYRISGARLTASLPASKISWIRKNWPDVFRRARAFLAPKDYVRYRLTGHIATEVLDAAGMLLFDVRARRWSDEMIAVSGVRRDTLPVICDPWDVAGALLDGPAQQLGLAAGTPVMVGAGDDIDFLGFGLLESGATIEHIGTTGSIMACVDRPAPDPALAVELYCHVDPSLWLLGGSVSTAGGALDWAQRALLGNDSRITLEALLNDSAAWFPSVDSPLIFLPHLAGERCPVWRSEAKGGWLGLTLAHDRVDLARAVLEGVAFSLRRVLERIEQMGVSVQTLRVYGSSPDSAWLALRASVYNKPLRVTSVADPTSLGCMIVTGVGIGLYRDLAEGVSATRPPEHIIQPDEQAASHYERLFRLYEEASSACGHLFS